MTTKQMLSLQRQAIMLARAAGMELAKGNKKEGAELLRQATETEQRRLDNI